MTRPSVLQKLPPSCNLVYDILTTLDPGNGVIPISQRELAAIIPRSKTQIRRALKRLQGAKILRPVEKGKGQRKTVYYLRWKSFPQISGPLATREGLKDIKPTKGPWPSFSLRSLKNTPENQHLNQTDKRRLSFFARESCQSEAISGVLDCLWQRDAVAGVWLDAIRGLQGVMIDAQPEELVWRSRKAVAGLIGGLNEDGFKAIMLDQPAGEEQAVERDIATLDRRLRGLEKWGRDHSVTGDWFREERSQLTRERYETRRRLPSAICTDGFFKVIHEPQLQPRPAKAFKLSGFYTGTRTPLSGDALRKRKEAARKALEAMVYYNGG